MKKINFLMLFLVFIGLMTSCEVEPIDSNLNPQSFDDNTNNNSGATSFKANFSGATFTATSTLAYISGGSIRLEALRGTSGEGFAFFLEGTTVGTYAAPDNLLTYTPANSTDNFGYWAQNPLSPNQSVGSVTVTAIDSVNKTISGTFNFTGYWSDFSVTNIAPIVFSGGVFTNIPYSTQSPTGDTFYTKINGTEFVDNDIVVATVNDVIGIAARNAAQDVVNLGIKETLTVGSYTITGASTDQVQASYKLASNILPLSATAGTITITSKTTDRIVGTFSFATTNGTYQATSGTFDVAY
ncbi:DUF6252 family protein [Flavobacterium branchiophilum]|uniref:Lipoprotein n=1 Tax=Flavobacterium branchiophilum TaxID=55197 RepID=A0A2H3L0T2_9FLAO|nr:DUF6252 family protein [Flavobacterium branchiophilum]PDS26270.1 hypothetical protein B0A77_02870 [Flavobacterium branchiophilum]